MGPRARLALEVWLSLLLLAIGVRLVVLAFFPAATSAYDIVYFAYQALGFSGACLLVVYALNFKKPVP